MDMDNTTTDATFTAPQRLDPWTGIRRIAREEYFVSGHRTCQGCESAQMMRLLAKAAGPRSIVLGSTGCMYVANTSYYSTPWVLPWMHTQLGSAGSAAVGTAAALKALMRKGRMTREPINVIAVCGDGGGADMGLSAISAALQHSEYNLLILMYDNESYANTDIQTSGSSPYGVNTSFSPPGKLHRIMNRHWKKNTAAMLAAGHTECRYVGTVVSTNPLETLNKVRRALTVGGPTFIHALDPCPKGWDYDPRYSHELGELAVTTGIWPLYEIEDHRITLYGTSKYIADGVVERRPVGDYLRRQGRFAHFTKEDVDHFQARIDAMWDTWLVPGVLPFAATDAAARRP